MQPMRETLWTWRFPHGSLVQGSRSQLHTWQPQSQSFGGTNGIAAPSRSGPEGPCPLGPRGFIDTGWVLWTDHAFHCGDYYFFKFWN